MTPAQILQGSTTDAPSSWGSLLSQEAAHAVAPLVCNSALTAKLYVFPVSQRRAVHRCWDVCTL